jgi:hypothetical protein
LIEYCDEHSLFSAFSCTAPGVWQGNVAAPILPYGVNA